MSHSTAIGRRSSAEGRRPWRFWLGAVGAVVVLSVVAAAVLRSTLGDLYLIPSGSMEPTLQPGDRVSVDAHAYDSAPVARGDIVVFDGEGSLAPYRSRSSLERTLEDAGHWLGVRPDTTAYVKRVIGTGGDQVHCCTAQGLLEVNGQPLQEPYLDPVPSAEHPASAVEFTVEVPAGRLFLLGDHREVSVDSRALLGAPGGGMIPVDKVTGRVTEVAWSAAPGRSTRVGDRIARELPVAIAERTVQ